MPRIEVQNISKEYSGRYVLRDLCFTCQDGEIFVIVGPNGAGKTTLLRILNLLEEPTSGKVLYNGESIDYSKRDKVALRRKMGMVFQQTVLFNMSVFDNVAYPLRVRKIDKRDIEQRVRAALKLVRLDEFQSKNALALSGGEAQRVAIAQALAAEPELLLLDEPTANLDPRNISIVEEALNQINREMGTTIIMTTHNITQAVSLAHRIAFLNQGRMELVGGFQEVFRAPSFIESYARLENVFQGISRITADGTSIIDIGDGLSIEASFKEIGNVTLHIPPDEIILSSQPLISSPRNTFEGRIVEISDMGHIVKLKMKVEGARDFTVQITKRSFKEM